MVRDSIAIGARESGGDQRGAPAGGCREQPVDTKILAPPECMGGEAARHEEVRRVVRAGMGRGKDHRRRLGRGL